MALDPDPRMRRFFHGTTACLSALFRAERYPHKRPEELLEDLVATTPGDEGEVVRGEGDRSLR
jgi:hypothetical protein